jgi:DNA-binding transcriptional MerR regulator
MSEQKNYSIGEVSRLLNVKEHTIRFWESKFPHLKPRKSETGRRVFYLDDIKILQKIKKLLYEDGFTIKGAMKELESEGQKVQVETGPGARDEEIRKRTESVGATNKNAIMKEKSSSESLYRKVNKEILFRIYNEVEDLIRLWEDFPYE